MPARVAINLAPIVPDLIVHRKEIKKGVEWVSEKVSKKDLDEIDLTEPDEIWLVQSSENCAYAQFYYTPIRYTQLGSYGGAGDRIRTCEALRIGT